MASGFLMLLDDIASILQDASIMTKGGGKEDRRNSRRRPGTQRRTGHRISVESRTPRCLGSGQMIAC